MSGGDTVHEIRPNNPQALAKKKKKKKIIHSLESLKPHSYKSGRKWFLYYANMITDDVTSLAINWCQYTKSVISQYNLLKQSNWNMAPALYSQKYTAWYICDVVMTTHLVPGFFPLWIKYKWLFMTLKGEVNGLTPNIHNVLIVTWRQFNYYEDLPIYAMGETL